MSKVIMDGPQKCVECGYSFKGEKIPKGSQEFYGNHTHFSKMVGVYDIDLDRTVYFQCPECNAHYDRNYNITSTKEPYAKKSRRSEKRLAI